MQIQDDPASPTFSQETDSQLEDVTQRHNMAPTGSEC